MPTFISPSGNAEVWGERPDGYLTPEQWRAAHPAPQAPALTISDRFASLRDERDRRLAATDHLAMPDYPLIGEARAAMTAYRQALRDLPGLDGAPWDGGGEATRWPVKPAITRQEI